MGAWFVAWIGCVPWPHDQQRTPEVTGVLQRGGAALADVPVSLSANPVPETGCPDPVRQSTTDAGGRFVLASTSDRLRFLSFGDRRDTWRVCFGTPDAPQWEDAGFWGGPASQSLSCDLDDDPICAGEAP